MRSAASAGLFVIASSLSGLAVTSALAVEPNIYVNRGEWAATLRGDGETGENGPSRRFDVDETLDLDVDQRVSTLDSFFRYGKNYYMISWAQVRYSGSNRLDDDLVFEGTTYGAGGRLRSTLHHDRWRLMYGRPFISSAKLAGGYLVGIEDYRIEQDAQMVGVRDRTAKIQTRAPLVGLSLLAFPVRYMRIYVEATGMSYTHGRDSSRLFNGYARLEYDLYEPYLAVSVGYRYAIARGEDRDAKYDLQQRGLDAGLTLKF